MRHHLRVVWCLLELHITREMQYRAHFFGALASSLAHTLMFLVFIETILNNIPAIGFWTRPHMYVVYGTFVVVEAIAQFAIQPNIDALSDSVRRGELDYIFTKPLDAQVYVSLRTFNLPALGNVIAGMAIILYGMAESATPLAWPQLLAYLLLLACGIVIIYSLWLLSALYVFKAIRLESIAYLFVPVLQVARYPIDAYPRLLQVVLRYVIPLVFVATVPAETLIGLTRWPTVLAAVATATLFFTITRIGWHYASRTYTSASS